MSTTLPAVPAFPAASAADTPTVSALPGDTGTVARHVPACGVPPVRVAATPFTITALTPTTSVTCITTSEVAAMSSASGDGDVTVAAGAVVSTTVTWNVAVAELPCVSDVEQLTVVVPSGNVDPDGGVHVTAATGPSTMSVAVGSIHDAGAPSGPLASMF